MALAIPLRARTSSVDLTYRNGEGAAARKRRRLLVLKDNARDAELVADCIADRSSAFCLMDVSDSTPPSSAHSSNGRR